MVKEIKQIGSLEIEPSAIHLDHRFLIFQKIGFTILCIIILCGIFGVFGSGIFGACKSQGSFFEINYNRFLRLQAGNVLQIQILPNSTANGLHKIQLGVSKNFFNKNVIKSIIPEPIFTQVNDEQIVFLFLANVGKGSATITFAIEPREFGRLKTNIEMMAPQKERMTINQFIYP